jgi:hypothetical protein
MRPRRFQVHSLVFMAALAGVTTAWPADGPLAAGPASSFEPGLRVLLDAHNAYPEQGRWGDRLERALGAGLPLAIEQDLVWRPRSDDRPAHSIVSHGQPFTGEEPTLRETLERLRPIVSRALADDARTDWPLVTLNLDFKDNDVEHLREIWNLLGRYESWLTIAERTRDGSTVSPLQPGPLLVLCGEHPAQQSVFHDAVPVGARLRVFGSYHPPRKAEAETAGASAPAPRATNYRRWSNNPWRVIEPEGQPGAGPWTADDEARLRALVQQAHEAGLWIRFYTLNGHPPEDGPRFGWNADYNFGSVSAVHERWRAAFRAGVDFIATDQYETLAEALASRQVTSPARKHFVRSHR